MMKSVKASNQVCEEPADQSKMILVWGREDVLAKGFELFLTTNKKWEAVRFSDKHNENFIIQKVKDIHPDVVILYQGNNANQTDLPARLLQDRPELKVIIVSLEN